MQGLSINFSKNRVPAHSIKRMLRILLQGFTLWHFLLMNNQGEVFKWL